MEMWSLKADLIQNQRKYRLRRL